MDGRWLSTDETARVLGVHPETVPKMIGAKRLPAYRFGHAYRVDSGELAEFVRKSRTCAGDAAGAAHQAVCGS